ncbi:conserved hypothetical protein [metagenome]|uniref:Sulfotransferase family protein n=1 Tax=metagenome TaxID=256318 RepID=A0A2P2BXG1_9ZZZZ
MSSGEDLLVPEGTRLLHIGPHKTGSTAIQVGFNTAREALAEHGVVYAGSGLRPQVAGWALGLTGRPAGSPIPRPVHWRRLRDEVAAVSTGRVCISNEDFGRAGAHQRSKIVRDLGGEQVHVVAAARRLDSFLPSQWQQRVRAGDARSFDEWLRVVLDRSNPSFSWDRMNVWRAHDTTALVTNWTTVVSPDRFTLVVLDETDRRLLPATFEQLLGLPDRFLDSPADRSNRGLTWAEVELVRSVNLLAEQEDWPEQLQISYIRRAMNLELRGRAITGDPRMPPLPAWALEQVREISEQRVEELATLGVRVIGNLETLKVPDSVVAASPGEPPPTVDLETAALAVGAVVHRIAHLKAKRAATASAPAREATSAKRNQQGRSPKRAARTWRSVPRALRRYIRQLRRRT